MKTKMTNMFLMAAFAALIVGCGGGGGGGTAPPTGNSPPPPSSSPPPPPPVGTSLELALAQGDYWEFFVTDESFSFAQPNTNRSSISVGRFRLTLGTPVLIGGINAFPLELSGEALNFSPRWTHLALGADGSILGSTDGASLSTVYNAITDEWVGGGFFVEFPSDEQVDFFPGTFDGEYNEVPALVATHSTSSGGCEQVLGMTFCDDESTSFTEREYYKLGVGPIGYALDAIYTDNGGGFFTSFTDKIRVELIDSSFSAADGTTFNLPPYESVAPMNVPRWQSQAYAVGGKIWVIGGQDIDESTTDVLATFVEVYDPETDSWSFSTPPPSNYFFSAGGVFGNLIYLEDRLTSPGAIIIFDTESETWSSIQPVSGSIPFFCDAARYDDSFGFGGMLVGAKCNFDGRLEFTGYAPSTNQTLVSSEPDLGLSRLHSFTVEVVGDRMFVIGGFGQMGFLDDRGSRTEVWEFDLLTGAWSTTPNGNLIQSRENHSSVVWDDKIYVFGGLPVSCSSFTGNCNGGNPMRSAELYDPATGTSEELPSGLTPRDNFEAVVLDGKIYLIGGNTGSETTRQVDRFTP